VDREGPCGELPETDVVLIAGRYVYMLHDLETLHLDPAAGKFAAVLFGHSHIPNFYRRKGVLYFNPGSCGPRRFDLPVSVGLLTVSDDGEFEAESVKLIPA
jgi:putative phosphoesterase